jgi:hypothetical protein
MKYFVRLNYGAGESEEADVPVGELISGTFGIDETNLIGGKDVFWCTDDDLDGEIYATRPHMEFFPVKTRVIRISSEDELKRIGNDPKYPLCGRYILTQDIELTESPWISIGSKNDFNGVFHGGGHTIKGLRLLNGEHCGLFSTVRGGTVRELNIELAYSRLEDIGYSGIGGLAGSLWYAKVKQVSVRGSEIFITGGITEPQSFVFGGEEHFLGNVGGLVGKAFHSSISNSHTAVNIYCQGMGITGGVIGELSCDSTLENCCSVGDIEGDHIAGGIVGAVNYAGITGCRAYGSVRAGTFAGGLVGSLNPGRVENSFYAGESVSSFFQAGRITGRNTNEHFKREERKYFFKNNFASSKAAVNGKQVKTDLNNGKTASAEELNDSQFLIVSGLPHEKESVIKPHSVRFDFAGGSADGSGEMIKTTSTGFLATLKIPKPAKKGYFFDGFEFDGKSFTPDTPVTRDITVTALWKKDIEISSAEELLKIGNDGQYPLNGNYRLKADIELDPDKPWVPIGGDTPFTGIFDGEGHTVTGINLVFGKYAGLFGYIRGAVVKNLYLVLSGANLRIPENEYGDHFMAGVVGIADNSLIERVLLTGAGLECHNRSKGFGGIAAVIKNESVIKECCSLISLTGDSLGGLCGNAYCKSVIDNCYNAGTLDGVTVSGLLNNAEDDSSLVLNSYSAADITSSRGGNQIANIEPRCVKNSVYLGGVNFKKRNEHCDNKESYLVEGDKTSAEYYADKVLFKNFAKVWRIGQTDDGGYPYPVLRWIKKGVMRKLTVRFFFDGGVTDSGETEAKIEIISANIGAHLFPKPKKAGFTLSGWTDKSGNPIDRLTHITADMELYAVYKSGETESEKTEPDYIEKMARRMNDKPLNMF